MLSVVSEHVSDLAIYAGAFLAFAGVMKIVVNASLRGIEVVLERQLRPFARKVDTITNEMTLNDGASMKDALLEVRANQNVAAVKMAEMEGRQRLMLHHFGLTEGLIDGD